MSRGPRPSAVKFDAALTVAGLSGPTVFTVPTERISVRADFNPRGRYSAPDEAFNEASLRALGESMQRDGVLSPLLVTRDEDDRYWLIAGERRLRAAHLVGIPQLPVMLKSEQEAARLALVENLQRQNLNAVDETFGVFSLLSLETGLQPEELPAALRAALREPQRDHHQLAARLQEYGGYSLEAWARHRPAFLKMTAAELSAIRQGLLPWRTVAELTRLPEGQERTALLKRSQAEQLSTAQVAALVKEILGAASKQGPELQLLVSKVKAAKFTQLPPTKKAKAESLLRQLLALLEE